MRGKKVEGKRDESDFVVVDRGGFAPELGNKGKWEIFELVRSFS